MYKKIVAKISAQPHTLLYMHFLTQTLFVFGTAGWYDSDACIINVWGCAEIFPKLRVGWMQNPWTLWFDLTFPIVQQPIRSDMTVTVCSLEIQTHPRSHKICLIFLVFTVFRFSQSKRSSLH